MFLRIEPASPQLIRCTHCLLIRPLYAIAQPAGRNLCKNCAALHSGTVVRQTRRGKRTDAEILKVIQDCAALGHIPNASAIGQAMGFDGNRIYRSKPLRDAYEKARKECDRRRAEPKLASELAPRRAWDALEGGQAINRDRCPATAINEFTVKKIFGHHKRLSTKKLLERIQREFRPSSMQVQDRIFQEMKQYGLIVQTSKCPAMWRAK